MDTFKLATALPRTMTFRTKWSILLTGKSVFWAWANLYFLVFVFLLAIESKIYGLVIITVICASICLGFILYRYWQQTKVLWLLQHGAIADAFLSKTIQNEWTQQTYLHYSFEINGQIFKVQAPVIVRSAYTRPVYQMVLFNPQNPSNCILYSAQYWLPSVSKYGHFRNDTRTFYLLLPCIGLLLILLAGCIWWIFGA
jgi:hypothetical protein